MAPDANPSEEISDEERLRAYGAELADGVEAALPGWVEAGVARILTAYRGAPDEATMAEARSAGVEAQREIAPKVRALLARDVDQQKGNPLAVIREATVFPTEVLRAAGVPPVVRDAIAEAQFPDDHYDLMPGSFADLDPSLHELGLRWGAAKAFVHKQRHRSGGASPNRL